MPGRRSTCLSSSRWPRAAQCSWPGSIEKQSVEDEEQEQGRQEDKGRQEHLASLLFRRSACEDDRGREEDSTQDHSSQAGNPRGPPEGARRHAGNDQEQRVPNHLSSRLGAISIGNGKRLESAGTQNASQKQRFEG